MVNYESFYEGGYSSLSPDYGNFVGYRLQGGELGQSINPATANQLKETMNALKTGVQQIEVQMLGSIGGAQDVDQTIPKQHFKEMRGLLKLSGASASLHGPILDPAGFNQQRVADKVEREENERRFLYAVEKAYELDPHGNIPVVFHAANGSPGPVYKVDKSKKPGEEGRLIMQQNFAVDRETGQVAPLSREEDYISPERVAGPGPDNDVYTPEDQLISINNSEWRKTMTNLAEYSKHAEELFGTSPQEMTALANLSTDGERNIYNNETGEKLNLSDTEKQQFNSQLQKLEKADIFLENVELQFNNAFQKAYKYGSPKQKEELKQLAEDYTKKSYENKGAEFDPRTGEIKPLGKVPLMQPFIKQNVLQESIQRLNNITEGGRNTPQQFVDAQNYAKDESSKTFGNVAFEAYNKFGKDMPVLAIENWAPGTAFHRGEDLNALVEESRKKFAEKLQERKGFSTKKAKEIAKKHIGATWDVGHINLYRKYGWEDEDLIQETAKVAKNVKHLHLTDNFGYSDSHLVPGMGNVPIKEHLEKLEKAGVLNKVRKVVEAGGYIGQISQQGAHGDSVSAFGSPIYGAKMASYWNQNLDIRGNYFGGYGTQNPPNHHNLYGAGFTSLPMELGGNIPGGGSRFSGNQMA